MLDRKLGGDGRRTDQPPWDVTEGYTRASIIRVKPLPSRAQGTGT